MPTRSLQRLELRVTRSKLSDPACARGLGRVLGTSADAAPIARELIGSAASETLIALLLDTRNRIRAYTVVAVGSLNHCSVELRDLFRVACVQGARAIVLAHNHPSGECTPSSDDIALTARVMRAGALLGIEVLDHIIVTEESAYSFLDNGTLLSLPGERCALCER